MIAQGQALALCMTVLATGWANAQPVDAAMVQALEQRTAAYQDTMRAGQVGGVVDFLPPTLIAIFSQQAGMSEQDFRRAAKAQAEAGFASGDLNHVEFRFDMQGARLETSPAGRPVALIDTQLSVPGLINLEKPVVALVEDGTWYLVRMDGPGQRGILEIVYPDLAGLDIWR